MKSDILLACALLPHLFGNFHSIWHGSVVCTTTLEGKLPQGPLASDVPSVLVTNTNAAMLHICYL